MQINVQSVINATINKGGKSRPYGEAKIEFLNERGEVKSWTVRSFSNPSVFKTLSEATNGQTYEITTGQKGEYTEWTSATLVSSDTPSETHKSPATPKSLPVKSTYETTEERAVKQRLIVRQSSIAQSVQLHGAGSDLGEVFATAAAIADWVYQTEQLQESLDDIPF